jgi:DNA-binding transcriptional regulator LsrR (DeoR family)
MTKISVMYYIEGLNQQQITDQLNISRPQISRLLSNARAEGIVDITVRDEFADERRYESWLCDTFQLKNAVVIDDGKNDRESVVRMISSGVNELLNPIMCENDVVGVSAGNSIAAISFELRPGYEKKINVVPLIGGIGIDGTRWQANTNARRFADSYKGKSWQLNAPITVTNEETYEFLIREPEISQVLNLSKNCSVALTGIGEFEDDATIIKAGVLKANEIDELKNLGAVASICCSFLDKNGEEINYSAVERMVGLSISDLKRIPRVIAISWGQKKVPAITAALRGKWLDSLVTTLGTVKSIAKFIESPL